GPRQSSFSLVRGPFCFPDHPSDSPLDESARLVHTNRRLNGAWTQRYEHGVPVSDLEPVEVDGTTGTPAHFKPDESLGSVPLPEDADLSRLATAWPHLEVQVNDQRLRRHGPRSADWSRHQ
ncbi:hypothetical protein ACIBKZ_35545, partial [Streptomyces sp. NPDC050421]